MGDLLHVALNGRRWFAERDADLCQCPSTPAFVSAFLFKHTSLFFPTVKKKKSTRKAWQIFPACQSCGSVLLIEFLIDYSRAAVRIDQMHIRKQTWVRLYGAIIGI